MESAPPNFDLAKSDPTVVDFVIIRFVGYSLALESGTESLGTISNYWMAIWIL